MSNNLKDIIVAQKIANDVIVINKGQEDNIEPWMKFLVYEESGEVIDPVTKESLGKLEKPKGYFIVQHVQEKMTVIVSELTREKKIFSNPLFNTNISVERDILQSIKIGDKVKVVNNH